MSLAWSLAAVPFLIALNAFFVAAEYAVVSLDATRLARMRARCWWRTAEAVTALQASPAATIGAIQVCITMTNLLLGWIGEPAMSALLHKAFGPLVRFHPGFFGALSTGLSFVVVTLLTVVFSELLPKALTLRHTEAATVLTARFVLAIRGAVRPVIWVMNALANAITRPLGLGRVEEMEGRQVSVDELRIIAQEAAARGVLTPRTGSLVLNSLTLSQRIARQIMVPRVRVAWLDLGKSMAENREVVDRHLYTRLPLCDGGKGGLDGVLGVVGVKEFLTAQEAGGETHVLLLLAHPPVFVPETLPLDRLLATFKEAHTQIAFVVDEHGGVEGIVALQDVVDELLSEIGETIPSPSANGPSDRVQT